MKDVEHQVHQHMKQDKEIKIKNTGYTSKIFLGIVCVALVVAVFSGYFVAGYQNYMAAFKEVPDASNQYVINDYKITFLDGESSEMQGLYGFTWPWFNDDIYIRKGLDLDQVVSTCEHELMHNLGIPPRHHDYIERNEGSVESSTCYSLRRVLVKENRTDLVDFEDKNQ